MIILFKKDNQQYIWIPWLSSFHHHHYIISKNPHLSSPVVFKKWSFSDDNSGSTPGFPPSTSWIHRDLRISADSAVRGLRRTGAIAIFTFGGQLISRQLPGQGFGRAWDGHRFLRPGEKTTQCDVTQSLFHMPWPWSMDWLIRKDLYRKPVGFSHGLYTGKVRFFNCP